jgi:prefoldin subunit 5
MSHLELQIKVLTQQVELLTGRIVELETENQQLRDKIARLKNF